MATNGRRKVAALTAGTAMLVLGAVETAASPVRTASAHAARTALSATAPEGSLAIEGVLDVVSGERIDLELRRFEAVAPGAELVVAGAEGTRREPLPRALFFRGAVRGEAGSRAFVALLPDGRLHGAVLGDEIRLLGSSSAESAATGQLEARRLAESELAATREPFRCGGEGIGDGLQMALPRAMPAAASAPDAAPAALFSPTHTAVYAVESDFEYYQRFNDTTAASAYATELLAFLSMLYDDEIATTIRAGSIFLHTTAADPWDESNPLCALFEFGSDWNVSHIATPRTAAVMLSSKNNGGGVAWVGSLCTGALSSNFAHGCTNFPSPLCTGCAGSYAYVGDIDGDFDVWNPQFLWDVIATAHEIGHNFNSPHTHCYANVGGNTNPIDACYGGECGGTGCYCGATSLPGAGALAGGSSGQHNGTIMSYCHLLSGGYNNIAFSFGTGHTSGIAAGREATRMKAFADSTAGGACMPYQSGAPIFLDSFETANVSRWNGEQP